MQIRERAAYNDRRYIETTEERLAVGDDLLSRAFPEEMALRGRRILSLGCGPCVELRSLIADNHVVGVDISPKSLEDARALGVEPIFADLEESLDLPDQSFDVAIAKDVLEHLISPVRLLREMRRVLKDDGFAVVNVPNPFVYSMRLRILLGKGIVSPEHASRAWDYYHLRFFTYQDYIRMLDECGFKVVKQNLDIFPAVPKGLPGFLDRFLARRLPSLFSHSFFTVIRKRNG